MGVRESVPDIGTIEINAAGVNRRISLADAFGFHGHSCPGVTTTFRALQYGIHLLFGSEVPRQGDLVIVSKTPTSGSLDLLDLVMIGEKRAKKTSAPEGMPAGRDNFAYTLYRKSNSTAVDIRMKPEHYPEDFFALKKKQSARELSEDEWDTLHGYMKNIILTFPKKSPEELFGKPEPYKTIVWGSLMPAHRTIR
jgi:formylmethanofuran dehydrogenase subunit E